MTSPRRNARIAGIFYLLNILTGIASMLLFRRDLVAYGNIANLSAAACYVVVTILFYTLFKPVSPSLSLLAAIVSLAGCTQGSLTLFHLSPIQINSLAFFGLYCLLIGYLILKSIFLPPILGVLMAIGGLGWITFLSPSLSHSLSPYNMAPGVLGESVLTLWLMLAAVNEQRWRRQASGMAGK